MFPKKIHKMVSINRTETVPGGSKGCIENVFNKLLFHAWFEETWSNSTPQLEPLWGWFEPPWWVFTRSKPNFQGFLIFWASAVNPRRRTQGQGLGTHFWAKPPFWRSNSRRWFSSYLSKELAVCMPSFSLLLLFYTTKIFINESEEGIASGGRG